MEVRPLDYPATMPNVIRSAASRFGEREYIVTKDACVTFGDVDVRSRRLAKRLLGAGAGKGTRVGFLAPQGPDFVVTLLAITRIGALAVPLSTFLRGQELRRAIAFVDVEILITTRQLVGRDMQEGLEEVVPELASARDRSLWLEGLPYLRYIWIAGEADRPWASPVPALDRAEDDGSISDVLLEAVESAVVPSDSMVVICTSGATAEPKAVVHTHSAQVRHAWTLAQLYEFTPDVRTFTNMPFFWVGGLTVTLLTHLHVGGAVITADRMDTGAMLDLIEAARPTRMTGWTLAERLTADPSFASRDLSWLPDIRQPELRAGGARHTSLGMSETCGPHTAAPASENDSDLPDHLRGSFGPPVPGVEHKIVEPHTGVVLEEGIEGEICIRGYSLMEGLYKKPRAEVFDADGWYHTGDKGFFRDGFLFFTGRRTEMIKTGGANVAPREVELAMEALPEVKAAFVVGIPDAERGELVGCLVCPEGDLELDPDALRERLRGELSSYKVPREIMVLPYDDAPWLPSGKISKPRVVELLTKRSGGMSTKMANRK